MTNAISDFVEVKDHYIKYQLPLDFDATRVQLIILPINDPLALKANRLKSLRGSITGKAAESLDKHIQTVRE